MKYCIFILVLITTQAFGQISLDDAKKLAAEHQFTTYRYHQKFEGHAEYSAPIVISDETIVFFSKDKQTKEYALKKIKSDGELIWKFPVKQNYDELESQSLLITEEGMIFAFLLSYNYDVYRGGTERVILLDSEGSVVWDKLIGEFGLVNSPTFSWIRINEDGKVEMRGHIVTEFVEEDERPVYHYWRGWLDSEGNLNQEIGDALDWSDPATKALFEVED